MKDLKDVKPCAYYKVSLGDSYVNSKDETLHLVDKDRYDYNRCPKCGSIETLHFKSGRDGLCIMDIDIKDNGYVLKKIDLCQGCYNKWTFEHFEWEIKKESHGSSTDNTT